MSSPSPDQMISQVVDEPVCPGAPKLDRYPDNGVPGNMPAIPRDLLPDLNRAAPCRNLFPLGSD